MDIKDQFMSELNKQISEYEKKEENLEPIMPGDVGNSNHPRYRLRGAIVALDNLKLQIERIRSYTSASDFIGQVELQIGVTHEKLKKFPSSNSLTYQDAKLGIIEAFDSIHEILASLKKSHFLS